MRMPAGLVFLFLGLLLCARLHAGTVTYVYTDPQGTALAEADASGNITATFDYRPYGVVALGTAPSGPGYTGHVNDSDTGLVYMQARYYDPAMGRFISTDPVEPSSGALFVFNRYTYANDNPYRYTDPDGRKVIDSIDELWHSSSSDCHSNPQCRLALSTGSQAGTKQASRPTGQCDLPECNEIRQIPYDTMHKQGEALQKAGLFAGKFAALNFLGDGIGRIFGKLGRLGSILGLTRKEVSFGRNANQAFHTFRHIEEAGLDREMVQSAIQDDLRSAAARIQTGKPFNQTITVGGSDITYTAYKLEDGSINVGRITANGQ